MRKTQSSTYSLALMAIFAALLIIFNYFRIEIGLVPVTLQTVIILLAGGILGSFRGAMVVIIALLINMLHFPAFPDKAGFAIFSSITFGYILGWAFAAFFVGLFVPKMMKSASGRAFPYLLIFVICTIAAIGIIYLFGVLWAGLLFDQSIKSLWVYFVAPFLIPDLAKAVFVTFLLSLLQKYRLVEWI